MLRCSVASPPSISNICFVVHQSCHLHSLCLGSCVQHVAYIPSLRLCIISIRCASWGAAAANCTRTLQSWRLCIAFACVVVSTPTWVAWRTHARYISCRCLGSVCLCTHTPPRSASVLAMPSKALSAKEKQNRAQAAFELKCEREEHAARLKSMKKDMVEARKAYSKHNTTVTSSQLDFWRLRLMGRGCSASM